MFGVEDYTELSKPRDLAKIFETAEYMKWRSFRDSEDSRFVSLVMPRVIARLPYGEETKAIDEFGYEEAPVDAAGAAKPMGHHDYCWMNAAYVMGARMTDSFRALPQGHGARQDRQPDGSIGLRYLAEPLDQQLRQQQRKIRRRVENAETIARGKGRGQGNSRQAWSLQCDRPSPPVAAAGGVDHQHAAGG